MTITSLQSPRVTAGGRERLGAELARLLVVRSRQTAGRRGVGWVSDEPSGHGDAPDDVDLVRRRITELEIILASAEIASPPTDGTVGLGSRVQLRLAAGAPPTLFEVVGSVEVADADRGISIDSPVGQALAGRRAGEQVEVQTPRGTQSFEIVGVA